MQIICILKIVGDKKMECTAAPIEKVVAVKNVDTDALILENRTSAQRMARSLLKRWGAFLDSEEVVSLTDLSLCEAARSFDPNRGVRFTSFLFYTLRGNLIRALTESCRRGAIMTESDMQCAETGNNTNAEGGSRSRSMDQRATTGEEEESCPEKVTYLKELRAHCNRALNQLSQLERKIVIDVHVLDWKVARVARKIGYSRGHVSALRKDAFAKLRPMLVDYKEAA